MGNKLDNVVSLYLHGVRDGHVLPAAEKYLAPEFIDHLGATERGRGAFLTEYQPLVNRFRDRVVWPLRAFEDGPRVFLHSYQNFGRGHVTRVCAEVFETNDADEVTGRWGVSAPVVSSTRSGRSQIDGPTYVDVGQPTEANREHVRRFHHDVLRDGQVERLAAYLHPTDYAEHSPDVADGLAGVRHHLRRGSGGHGPVRYGSPQVVVARGDYVATLSLVTDGAGVRRVFDLYRLAGGRIVEHWDVGAAA